MKIALCIKQVPKSAVSVGDDGNLKRAEAAGAINMYDYSAIETALRLKEKLGGTVDIFTMGPGSAEAVIREAYTLGADMGYLISDRVFAGSDVLATSYTIAMAIKQTGRYDLVLCGRQSVDGDTGQVPAELAARLGYKYFFNVDKLMEIGENSLKLRCIGDGCKLYFEAKYPAVIAVEPSIFTVRMPKLKAKLKSRKMPFGILTAETLNADPKKLGKNGSATDVIHVFQIPHKKAAQPKIMSGAEVKLLIEQNFTEVTV